MAEKVLDLFETFFQNKILMSINVFPTRFGLLSVINENCTQIFDPTYTSLHLPITHYIKRFYLYLAYSDFI